MTPAGRPDSVRVILGAGRRVRHERWSRWGCASSTITKTGCTDMAGRKVRIWYDPEGDYPEVMFDQGPGYFRETSSDQVMEKVDESGNLLGFSVMKVGVLKRTPLEVAL